MVLKTSRINLAETRFKRGARFTICTSLSECLVIARPLTNVRSDNEDKDPLTPNHFLIGRAFPNIPACVFNENPSLKTKTWTQIRQHFKAIWKRLVREHLRSMNALRKWTKRESKLDLKSMMTFDTKKTLSQKE